MTPRRILAMDIVLLFIGALAAVIFMLWLRVDNQIPSLAQLSFGDLWMNWFKWPTLLFLSVLGVGSAWAYDGHREAAGQARQAAAEEARRQQEAAAAQADRERHHRFAAQVVGVQWLNPLQRRDYPTEWQTLWTLGLAKPNADDDVVPTNPERWSKVRPIAGLAFNLFGDETIEGYFETYTDKLFGKLWERYFAEKHYFYSVAKGAHPRREVTGIRVELALPGQLPGQKSADLVRNKIASYFSLKNPKFSATGELPDVHLHQGGPAAGFAALESALGYLEAHPDKTVWVVAFDAPSFPKDEQLNETGALLVLAHPDYQTGREPLAWIHRESRVSIGKEGQAAAWKVALTDAAQRGQLAPAGIGYLIHDAGNGSDAASRRLGPLAQAVTEAMPDKPFLDVSFNTPALLGELNAGTAATNLVLAIAYAHHRNTPVVVAGTRETQAGEAKPESKAVTAVLVRPPAKPTPFDPNKTWFRARGEGNAYLPWWSRRHDAEANRMQGWSD